MTALFNTIGHETEQDTSVASAELFRGLAQINDALWNVERRNPGGARAAAEQAAQVLRTVEASFEQIANQAGDFLLFQDPPVPQASSIELAELWSALRAYGVGLPLRNNDVPRVAAREIRGLIDVLDHAQFTGRHADWYASRDIINQTNRLTSLGVLLSRVSALHGGDPRLSR
jgi:hypothetical protein